ncbi:hypothetical protein OSTOST_16369, partial [Ostertagia ostertagi]
MSIYRVNGFRTFREFHDVESDGNCASHREPARVVSDSAKTVLLTKLLNDIFMFSDHAFGIGYDLMLVHVVVTAEEEKVRDAAGYQAIAEIHREMDDDHSGSIDRKETTG